MIRAKFVSYALMRGGNGIGRLHAANRVFGWRASLFRGMFCEKRAEYTHSFVFGINDVRDCPEAEPF